MSKITIIIPVYNAEKYLNKCLDSVFSQTLDDIDVIAINDGSKDNSLNILNDYKDKHDNLTIIDQRNKGISIARNNGIEIAKGEFIAFLDSDDYLESTMYEELYKKAKASDSDIVVCNYFEEYNDIEKKEINIPQFQQASISLYPNMINDINTSPWNKLYKASLIQEYKIRFPLSLKYEDVVFVLHAIAKANHVSSIDLPLLNYNIREGSETKVVNAKVFDIFKILDLINELFQNENMDAELFKNVEYFNIRRITIYVLQQVYQKDKMVYKRFVKDAYHYLEKHYPNWRANEIFNHNESFAKRMLKKHKGLAHAVIAIKRISA